MANIYFRSMKLENFMSYKEAELHLNRSGYVVVKGVNNNPEDSAKSNGSGKSSLFSALSWCLTGETVNGAKNVSNIYTEGKTSVSVEFDLDKHTYIITRTKNPSNLFIKVDGVDKSGKGIRDTEKIVEEYLPQLTHSLLNSVIILGQGLPGRFTNNTPSGRKEVLEKLSNSDFMIEDIKKRLTGRKDYLNKTFSDLKSNRDTKIGSIESLQRNITSLREELNSMSSEELEKEIATLSEEVNDMEEELSGLNVQYEEYSSMYQESIDAYNEFNSTAQKKIEEFQQAEFLQFDDTKLNSLKIELGVLENDYNAKKNITDVCPTCGQKIPGKQAIDPETLDKLHRDIISKRADILELENIKNDVKCQNNHKLEKYKTILAEESGELKATSDLHKEDLTLTTNKINLVTNQLLPKRGSLASAEARLSAFNETLVSINKRLEDGENELKTITKERNNLDERIEIISQHIDVNNKMFTLIKRDFRGYLLTNVIDFIANKAKIYCNDVFGTTDIEFRVDGNNIVIDYDGKEYEVLSGGEKQKVDVIIQLSIRDMLCKFLNFSSNILVLDEITDSLDIIGSQKIFNMISNRLSDVEAVYIISHHTDYDIPQDDEITIEKGVDKISRIV